MTSTSARPDRTLIAILCVIAALVIVALVVVPSRGAPERLDRGTPAGVVQAYASAVLDGDESTAAGYLTENAVAGCESYGRDAAADDLRITLVRSVERGDSADVTVSVATSTDTGPFGASGYETEGVFELVRVPDGWKIDSAPWRFAVCPGTKATS
jgi:hypothetical protein